MKVFFAVVAVILRSVVASADEIDSLLQVADKTVKRTALLVEVQLALSVVKDARQTEARELCTIARFLHNNARSQLKMLKDLPEIVQNTQWYAQYWEMWDTMNQRADAISLAAVEMLPGNGTGPVSERTKEAASELESSLSTYGSYLVWARTWFQLMGEMSSNSGLVGVIGNWAGVNDYIKAWTSTFEQGAAMTQEAKAVVNEALLKLQAKAVVNEEPASSLLQVADASLSTSQLLLLRQVLGQLQQGLVKEQEWFDKQSDAFVTPCRKMQSGLSLLPKWLVGTTGELINSCVDDFSSFGNVLYGSSMDHCEAESR